MEIHITYPTDRCIPSCVGGSIEEGEQVQINLLPDRVAVLNWPDFVVGTVVSVDSVPDGGGFVYKFLVDATQLYPVDPNTGEPITDGNIAIPAPCDFESVECYSCCQDIIDRFPQLMVEAIESQDLFIVANAIRNLINAAINDPTTDIYSSLVQLFTSLLNNEINDPNSALKALIVACIAAAGSGPTDAEIKALIEQCLNQDSDDTDSVVGLAIKRAINACFQNDAGDETSAVGFFLKQAIEACMQNDIGDATSVIGGLLVNLINDVIDANVADPNGSIKTLINTCIAGLGTGGGGPTDAEVKALIEQCLNQDADDTDSVVGNAIKRAINACLQSDASDENSAAGFFIKQAIQSCLQDDINDPNTIIGGLLKTLNNTCFDTNLADNIADPNGSIKTLINDCIDDIETTSAPQLTSREPYCNIGSQPVEFNEVAYMLSYSPASLVTPNPSPPANISASPAIFRTYAEVLNGVNVTRDFGTGGVTTDPQWLDTGTPINASFVSRTIENTTDADGDAIVNELLIYSLDTPFVVQPGQCRMLNLDGDAPTSRYDEPGATGNPYDFATTSSGTATFSHPLSAYAVNYNAGPFTGVSEGVPIVTTFIQ